MDKPKFGGFKTRGVKVEAGNGLEAIARMRRLEANQGGIRLPHMGAARQLQDAYSSRQRGQDEGSDYLSGQILTPLQHGINEARKAQLGAATGTKLSGAHTIDFTDPDWQAKQDRYNELAPIAENPDIGQPEFNDIVKQYQTQEANQNAHAALVDTYNKLKSGLTPQQQALAEGMMGHPEIPASETFKFLNEITTPKPQKQADPYEEYAKIGKALSAEAARGATIGSTDATAQMLHNNAMNDLQTRMNAIHEQLVPPPNQTAPAPIAPVPTTPAPIAPAPAPIASVPAPAPPTPVARPVPLGVGGIASQPQFAEGAIMQSPSTGQRFKIVNGQPQEIPTNVPNSQPAATPAATPTTTQ